LRGPTFKGREEGEREMGGEGRGWGREREGRGVRRAPHFVLA